VAYDPKSLLESLERIKREAEAMPARIAEWREKSTQARTILDDAKMMVAEHEAETLSLVSAETVDSTSTKLKFTNQAARDAETSRRLAADEHHRRLKTHHDEAARVKMNIDMQVAKMQDEEKSLDRQLEAVGLQLRAEIARSFATLITEFTLLEGRRLASPKGVA